MQPTSATSKQAGFTLLELIVGLTVGAILLTAIYATFVGVSQTQRRVETVLDRTATWRFVTETIRLDLARLKTTSMFSGSEEEFEAEFFRYGYAMSGKIHNLPGLQVTAYLLLISRRVTGNRRLLMSLTVNGKVQLTRFPMVSSYRLRLPAGR